MSEARRSGPVARLSAQRSRLARRTAQLPASSRALYRIEHWSSQAWVAVGLAAALLAAVIAGAAIGFPTGWVDAFEVSSSALTLVMVFAIQHTNGREQAATQRKLDELLRALPGATESLMMLEEAPHEVLLEVERDQREARDEIVEDLEVPR